MGVGGLRERSWVCFPHIRSFFHSGVDKKLKELAIFENWKPERVARKALPWIDSFSDCLGVGKLLKHLCQKYVEQLQEGRIWGKLTLLSLAKIKT